MLAPMNEDSEYWARYYEVTAERPAWTTVKEAIARFGPVGGVLGGDPAGLPDATGAVAPAEPRRAVDLGCGAGRDTRELLRAGWQVLAVDREPGAEAALRAALEPGLESRLSVRIEDLATVDVPACDLVNASLCLPFLAPAAFDAVWDRIVAALGPGDRFAAMLFGDHDGSAADPAMTCLPPDRIRSMLSGFEIEFWSDTEEDTRTALGEPHHFHLIEFVARKNT